MFKKICLTVLSFMLCCGFLTLNISASDFDNLVQYITFNEYEYIHQLNTATESELNEIGVNSAELDNINAEFYDKLYERSLLSDEELQNMGYSENEINIFRKYNNEDLTSAEIRAISGTCTGSITATTCTGRQAKFRYSWNWDHQPICVLKDSVAVRWLAYDSMGAEINVIRSDVDSLIRYFDGTTFINSVEGTEEAGLDFNTVNIQFDMYMNYTTPTTLESFKYAKSGYIDVTVEVVASVVNNINYLTVAGLYGHTVVGANFPSVSFSPPNTISIDFSGNISIDSIAGRQAVILQGPVVDYIY